MYQVDYAIKLHQQDGAVEVPTIGTSRARVRVQTWLDLLADVGFVPYPAADPWEAPVFLGKRPDRSRMSRAP